MSETQTQAFKLYLKILHLSYFTFLFKKKNLLKKKNKKKPNLPNLAIKAGKITT